MATVLTQEDISNNLKNAYGQTMATLDVQTPGSVEEDIFVNVPVVTYFYPQYTTLQNTQLLASLKNADLLTTAQMDELAANFKLVRISNTNAVGTLIFYASNMSNDVTIPTGTKCTTNTGIEFVTTQEITAFSVNAPMYYSTDRSRYEFSAPARCSLTGDIGNVEAQTIGLISGSINGVDSVVNLEAFSGGRPAETNSELADRVIGLFQARELNTPSGIINALIANFSGSIQDYKEVTKGNSAMVRDEGLGGKVDLYVLTNDVVEVGELKLVTSAGLLYPPNPSLPIVIPSSLPVYDLVGVYKDEVLLASSTALLARDITGVYSNSSKSKDYIYFTTSSGVMVGNYVTIKYNYRNIVSQIQQYFDDGTNKIGAVDVLIKEGTEVDVTIRLLVKKTVGVDFDTVRANIQDDLTSFGNTLTFGVDLLASTIIDRVKEIYGVDNVDKNNVIMTAPDRSQDLYGDIVIEDREYGRIVNVIVNEFV